MGTVDRSAARDRPERIFADDELEQRRRDMLTSSDVRTCLSCGQREVVADGGGFKCRSCGAEEPSAARVLPKLISLTPEAVAEAVAEWLTEQVADDTRAYGVAGPIDGRVMLLLKGGGLVLIDVNRGEVTLA